MGIGQRSDSSAISFEDQLRVPEVHTVESGKQRTLATREGGSNVL